MKNLRVIAFAALCFAAATSRGAVAFSSFGEPGDTWGNGVSPIYGTYWGGPTALADTFTSSFTGTMTSIELALEKSWDLSNVSISLLRCDPVTGMPLPSTRVFLAYAQPPTVLAIMNLQVDAFTLIAGEYYALEVRAASGAPMTIAGWAVATDPSMSLSFSSSNGGISYSGPPGAGHAFRINATPVPEPTVAVLVLIGIAGVFVRAKIVGRTA
jgi:hypothetical protein